LLEFSRLRHGFWVWCRIGIFRRWEKSSLLVFPNLLEFLEADSIVCFEDVVLLKDICMVPCPALFSGSSKVRANSIPAVCSFSFVPFSVVVFIAACEDFLPLFWLGFWFWIRISAIYTSTWICTLAISIIWVAITSTSTDTALKSRVKVCSVPLPVVVLCAPSCLVCRTSVLWSVYVISTKV